MQDYIYFCKNAFFLGVPYLFGFSFLMDVSKLEALYVSSTRSIILSNAIVIYSPLWSPLTLRYFILKDQLCVYSCQTRTTYETADT